MELESGNDSSVDLTGDAGVVGRWLVEGSEKNPELKMDLKGVVYAATTVSFHFLTAILYGISLNPSQW